MSELLSIYIAFSLAAATTQSSELPVSWFRMPFQDSYYFWKVIGFAGLAAFQSRWLVQWIYSEKHKESKVPPIFWWQSIIGSVLCLAYFLRQQDSVGVAGYIFNVVPYTRNLMLVYRKKRLDAAATTGFPIPPASSGSDH